MIFKSAGKIRSYEVGLIRSLQIHIPSKNFLYVKPNLKAIISLLEVASNTLFEELKNSYRRKALDTKNTTARFQEL